MRTRTFPSFSLALLCLGLLLPGSAVRAALVFDGVDDYLEVGPVYQDITNDFTIELWVYPQGLRAEVPGWRYNVPGNLPFAILPAHSFTAYPDRTQPYVGSSALGLVVGRDGVAVCEARDNFITMLKAYARPLSGWTHIAFLPKGRVCVNGTFLPEVSYFAQPVGNAIHPSADIGYNPRYGGQPGVSFTNFIGMVDELRIWRGTRSLGQIRAGMQRRMTGHEEGLETCFHFDEGNGTTARDVSHRRLEARLFNGVQWSAMGAPFERPQILPGEGNEFMKTPLTLHARINANGRACQVWFEFGETQAYGQETEHQAINAGFIETGIQAVVSTAPGNRLYHYRVVVEADGQRFTGSDEVATVVTETGGWAMVNPVHTVAQGFPELTNTFTLEAWVLPGGYRIAGPQGTNGGRDAMNFLMAPANGTTRYGAGHSGAGFSVGRNGITVCELVNGDIPFRLTHSAAILNWAHVAVVYDHGQPRLFLNGEPVATGTVSPYVVHPSLGTGPAGFLGKADELRVWSTARTPEQIRATLAQHLTGTEPGLVAYMDFNGGNLADLTFNGYDGTGYGGGPSFGSPGVLTVSATGLGEGSALFRGIVNPGALFMRYYFEFGPGYSLRTPMQRVAPTTVDQAVSASVSGLPAGSTSYAVRLVGESDFGREVGGGLAVPLQNGALGFDGGAGYATVGAAFSTVARNFTLEFWVKPEAGRVSTPEATNGISGVPGQAFAIHPLMGKFAYGDASHAGAGVSVGTNGISVFEHTEFFLPSPLVYNAPIRDWTHVAVVYAAGQPSLYVNGQRVRTGLVTGKTTHPSADLSGTTAALGGSLGAFRGQIDEVRVWRGVRSAEQIASGMAIRLAGTESNLVAYYRFDGDEGSASTDATGHGYTCAVVGASRMVSGYLPASTNARYKAGQAFPLKFQVAAPGEYLLESSPDLKRWDLNSAAYVGADRLLEWSDDNATNEPSQFYRVRPR